jgi:hypothetical protein
MRTQMACGAPRCWVQIKRGHSSGASLPPLRPTAEAPRCLPLVNWRDLIPMKMVRGVDAIGRLVHSVTEVTAMRPQEPEQVRGSRKGRVESN